MTSMQILLFPGRSDIHFVDAWVTNLGLFSSKNKDVLLWPAKDTSESISCKDFSLKYSELLGVESFIFGLCVAHTHRR